MEADRNQGSGAEDRSKGAADQLIDDEKVEKFYDLIRNYKEARDRQRIGMQRLAAGDDDEKRGRMKKLKLADREQTSWIPAFKWEDFAPAEHRSSSVIASASISGGIEKERRMREDSPPIPPADSDDSGLDLKLKL